MAKVIITATTEAHAGFSEQMIFTTTIEIMGKKFHSAIMMDDNPSPEMVVQYLAASAKSFERAFKRQRRDIQGKFV